MTLVCVDDSAAVDDTVSAARINQLHQDVLDCVGNALVAAVKCGRALAEMRANAPEREWSKWITDNLTFSRAWAHKYMVLAKNHELVLSADAPRTPGEAIVWLREMGDTGLERTYHGRKSAVDVEEARRMRAEGMSFAAIGKVFGVSRMAVRYKFDPEMQKKAWARSEALRVRRLAERKALERAERDAEVRRAGGKPADAYALIRRSAQAIDIAIAEAESKELRAELRQALTATHRAEEAIVRAIRIGRQS